MVFVYQGQLTIVENAAETNLGNIVPQIVLAVKENADIADPEDYEGMSGGKFNLKHIRRRSGKTIRKLAKAARSAGQLAAAAGYADPRLATALGALNMGLEMNKQARRGSGIIGGSRRRKRY